MGRLTAEELLMKEACWEMCIRDSCWVVCPWCDETKCFGRFECEEVKKYVEELGGESHDE